MTTWRADCTDCRWATPEMAQPTTTTNVSEVEADAEAHRDETDHRVLLFARAGDSGAEDGSKYTITLPRLVKSWRNEF